MAAQPENHQPRDPSQEISPPSTLKPRRSPPREEETESGEERQMKVGMRMVGSAMVFIGFLQVFLSASTGAEITVFPMIL